MANLIPEDLIISEILTRLPVKFLPRLTLICRRWRFLIKSTEFQIAHASYNLHTSPYFLINMNYADEFFVVDKDQTDDSVDRINTSIGDICNQIFDFYESSMEDRPLLYPDDPERAVSVIGCVHGLICFVHQFSFYLYFIWNPVTKMLKTVTKPSAGKILQCESLFCYDQVDKDFKIIDFEGSDLGVLLRIYSCNLNTWTEIRDDSLPISPFNAYCNFKDMPYLEFDSQPNVLVAFDVHNKVYKRLPFIDFPEDRYYCYTRWKDSLAIVSYWGQCGGARYDPEEIYTFDENSGAWVEQQLTGLIFLDSKELLLGLENGDIVVKDIAGNLKLFEAKNCKLKYLTTATVHQIHVMQYTESLVHLNGMRNL